MEAKCVNEAKYVNVYLVKRGWKKSRTVTGCWIYDQYMPVESHAVDDAEEAEATMTRLVEKYATANTENLFDITQLSQTGVYEVCFEDTYGSESVERHAEDGQPGRRGN